MKQEANKHRSERTLDIADLACVKLQPYRQHSMALRNNQKLGPKFFGPFLVVARVGTVAYRLQLPPSARIHPIFHMTLLKKHVGSTEVQGILPDVDDFGLLT